MEPGGTHLIQAAQYLRASTEHQRYSVPSQHAAIAAYAVENGYEIVRTYIDNGRSGVTITKREGLKALLADAVSGDAPFTVVLVLDVSRWGRFQNPDQAAHYEFICREAGVRVRYCAEAFEDDDSTSSSLMKNIKRIMAAEFSRQLSDRCRVGIRRRKLSGAKGGGNAPFGFSRQAFNDDGSPGPILGAGERRPKLTQTVRLVPGPSEEIQTVERIFRMFGKEMRGITEIASILNADGVFRRGQPWRPTAVSYVLRNELAVGIYAFDRVEWRFGKMGPVRPRAEWTRVTIGDPIISRALFDRAQAKLLALKGRVRTDDEMLLRLRRLLTRHGYLTRRLIDGADGMMRSPAYAARFGSLGEAYRLIGYEHERQHREHAPRETLEPDAIIARLRRLWAEKGFLSWHEVERCRYLPSVRTITDRFGSLTAAYRLAGYDLTRREMLVQAHARRSGAGKAR